MAIRKIASKDRIDKVKMDKIKRFVTKGYEYILLRGPDHSGLDTYSSLIYLGNMTKDAFLERLITSGEYNRLQDFKQNLTISLENIESIKEKIKSEEEEEERLEKEILEKERLEKRKLEEEMLEKERLEEEMLEKERLEKEKLEDERLEEEKSEGERLKKEMLETSRLVTEKNGKDGKKDIDSVKTIVSTYENKIVLVSTWGIKCGIAIYTKDLLESLDKLKPGLFAVRNMDTVYSQKGRGLEGSMGLTGSKLIELQHEFGFMQKPPEIGEIYGKDGIKSKVIIMWHTIPSDIDKTVKLFESKLNVVAHIVPCQGALKYMKPGITTTKDVYVVSLGSRLMPDIKKEDARQLLDFDRLRIGMGIGDKKIGFVFGFQSKNKNYQRLISAARNVGLYLIVSGSIHQCGYNSNIISNDDATMISGYLSDAEIDLYALASDVLLFDYTKQDHYSSSSALHRIVGAGRPVITVDTNHFSDIDRNIALKFNYQRGLENCIVRALSDHDRLGQLALEFAKKTSREEMAKKRLEIYSKYVDI